MIDVYTFITYGSSEYSELLHRSCEVFKSGNYKISYNAIESVGCDYWPKVWHHKGKTKGYGHGSMNHAMAIHNAIEKATEDYIIFIDCDVVLLMKNWDAIIVNELKSVDCFGGGYTDYYTAKYNNFPAPHLFCFKKNLKVEMDFSPIPDKVKGVYRFEIKTKEQEEIYHQKMGSMIKCDTGWKVPELFYRNKLKSKAMKMIYNFQNALLPYKNQEEKDFCNNYRMSQSEWHWNGKLFGTHKQLPRLGFGKKDYLVWKNRIDRYNGSVL